MTAALTAAGLSKRYGHRWALRDCSLEIPQGRVAALVGPNGAGKTTLLHLATGLLRPTTGTIEVLGGLPAASPAQLARVGFVAQDAPTYAGLSVADHLRLGAHLNPGWDADLAHDRIELLGTHRLVTGVRCDPATWPADWQVISASHTDRQSTLLVRTSDPVHDPAWAVEQIGLEDLVLAYMSQAQAAAPGRTPALEVQR